MPERSRTSGLLAAGIAAAAMITHQVAGKAMRDALFLSAFGISALPIMLIGSAAFSIVTGLLFANLLRIWEPRRAVPGAFIASAIMQIVEWWLSSISLAATALLVYLHMAAVGSALISGFWSVLNEKFDPHSGRREFTRITIGGTVGGLLGGILASALPLFMATTSILPLLAAFHIVCAWIVYYLGRAQKKATPSFEESNPAEVRSGYQALRQSPYLRQIALLVFLGTIGAAFLDYVFKVQAAASHRTSGDLVQFFAMFYATTGLLTLLIQAGLGRFSLERFGLVRTVSTLPIGVLSGAIGTLVVPGLATSTIARGSESVLRSSLFRSGYELLYTPVPEREKRAAKPIIDVVVERFGDLAGGVFITLAVLLNSGAGPVVLTVLTVVVAAVEIFIVRRLDGEYVKALEHNLRHRAIQIDPASVLDRSTRATLMRTLGTIQVQHQAIEPRTLPRSRQLDPLIQRLIDLRSGDANRVRMALRIDEGLDDLLVPQLIRLIGWDEVSEDTIKFLRQHAETITGQLVDALIDTSQEFAVRRRIPRILTSAATQRSVDGLVEGLSDRRFEVRLQCGRALSHIHEANPELVFDSFKIFNLIVRDIAIDKNVLLRQQLERDEQSLGDPHLAHIFRLLGLVLPSEPLRVAYRGLFSDDRGLQGTSLEYLETILPDRVRHALWPVLEQQNILRSIA